MNTDTIGPLQVEAIKEQWPLVAPFKIAGYTFENVDVILVRLRSANHVGLGEAAGVYYRGETADSLLQQIRRIQPVIESGISRQALQELLPAGGARNAVDCALWDLETGLCGRPAWQRAALNSLRSLTTTFTCGADTPERMAAVARSYQDARAIKLKLTGDPVDSERVSAVREARPDVWLGVDANQGFNPTSLGKLMPTLQATRVALIEQPFPIGHEVLLDDFDSPIPVAADESAQTLADLPGLVGRFDVVNIKLDKCGGLTEGLQMARRARQLGLETMIGNMLGTSLAMAPAYLVGQLCQIVDLDGPVFLRTDRPQHIRYSDGSIECPETVWGGCTEA